MHGPAITRFALRLADGVNVNRLNTISNNLAMTMKAVGLRIEIPIPGTSLVGIEVPNQKVSMVTLKEVLDSPAMRANPSPTAVAIGKDITGTPIICELSDMPHMLIAGATGSGKSVCINAIIQSILYRATPQQVRMIMIDPKLVELQPYNGIPHLLTEVVSEPKKAAAALDWLVQEMGDRYRKFQQAGVRNIAGYNKKMTNDNDKMPDIVAIIDEFSDLMVQCRKSVEESIQRLAALARAALPLPWLTTWIAAPLSILSARKSCWARAICFTSRAASSVPCVCRAALCQITRCPRLPTISRSITTRCMTTASTSIWSA